MHRRRAAGNAGLDTRQAARCQTGRSKSVLHLLCPVVPRKSVVSLQPPTPASGSPQSEGLDLAADLCARGSYCVAQPDPQIPKRRVTTTSDEDLDEAPVD
jgi:hypothetical protein